MHKTMVSAVCLSIFLLIYFGGNLTSSYGKPNHYASANVCGGLNAFHMIPRVTLTRGWFKMNMPSYQYRKYHCGGKTILWSSYLHNGISFTSKMTSLYWIRVLFNTLISHDCSEIAWTLSIWHVGSAGAPSGPESISIYPRRVVVGRLLGTFPKIR